MENVSSTPIVLIVVFVGIQILLLIAQYYFWPLFDSITRRRRFRTRYERRVAEVIDSEKGLVKLTWGAREMLTIPIVEAYERQGYVDRALVEESLRKIMATLKESTVEERASNESFFEDSKFRNSQDVIRAFHKRFCNIPPFCKRGPSDDQ